MANENQNQEKTREEKKREREEQKREKFKSKNPPAWAVDERTIDEPLFAYYFMEKYGIRQFNGKFYNEDGLQEDDTVRMNIAHEILPFYRTRIRERVNSLFSAMKILIENGRTEVQENYIHVRNGTLMTEGYLFPTKLICVNRFDVDYEENRPDDWQPVKFLAFLHELLEDDDIVTLQEYLGYCLIPCTRGQSALFIIGNGGEGKSRLGIVLKDLFKSSMITASLHRIENDKFFVSNLVDKLLMVDDDLQLQALSSTGMFKTIVTAETPIEVERKFEQSFQANIYCRFLCFGNGSPRALYDKTEGFSRRMIILSTKPKSPDRIDNPFIADDFKKEKAQIFHWLYEGLLRLISNNFKFTLSQKTLDNRRESMSNNCNIIDFLADDWVGFAEQSAVSSIHLYNAYCSWCSYNGLEYMKRDGFINWLKQNEEKYNILYARNIPLDDRKVRGFRGIYIKNTFLI